MTRERAEIIVRRLAKLYPQAVCALDYRGEGWKLLVLARLSAQCTDKRVNIVAEPLFGRWGTAAELARCDIAELEEIIRPCGLFHTKARDIRESCRILCDSYGGKLPDTMDGLLSLPGVGRKIANLLLGDLFGKPAIVVDTHCIRLAGRLGFCEENEKNPLRIEKILAALIPPGEQSDFCHRIVLFGRDVCRARGQDCTACPLADLCEHHEREAI